MIGVYDKNGNLIHSLPSNKIMGEKLHIPEIIPLDYDSNFPPLQWSSETIINSRSFTLKENIFPDGKIVRFFKED